MQVNPPIAQCRQRRLQLVRRTPRRGHAAVPLKPWLVVRTRGNVVSLLARNLPGVVEAVVIILAVRFAAVPDR
jgi:hypothetical protein